MEHPFFPMFIDIRDKEVLVVGGGRIALRRIRTLLRFGACIRVIAPAVCEEIRCLEAEGRISVLMRGYSEGDASGAFLVIAATDSGEINGQVWRECRELGIPVNTADDHTRCDFYFPSVVMTDGVVVGINSGGEDPRRVKAARRKIEELLDG